MYATQEERILVSQDADLSYLHTKWQIAEETHAGIMRIPHLLQGEALISFRVKQLLFYHEAEAGGAIEFATEIENTLIFL